ncbi:BadF/BadG/BcrA/BcrD ATPase family protein [soil metagenome]
MATDSPKIKSKRNGKSHNIYLGADGGGTKTHIVLIDERKNLVCEGFAGASNPLRVGLETAVANIIQAINSTCDQAQLSRGDIVSAVLGLAGVRREDLKRRVRQRFLSLTNIRQTEILTDAEIALYGTTLGKAGVVLIAGTGSICYGKDENGIVAMAGGWGPIAGDEGSGIAIARRALQAIAKASDGRGKPTLLSEAAMEYFRSATAPDLLIAIYSPQIDNARIAGFARFVVEAAQEGDEIAREILKEAGFELGLSAFAVIKRLGLLNRKVPIGQVGSIFKAGRLLTDSLLETVHSFAPKAFLAEPKLSPANAAAVLAFENFRKGEK